MTDAMRFPCAVLVCVVAACSSPEKPPVVTTAPAAPAPAPTPDAVAGTSAEPLQRRAIVRIDAEPGGKRFQGVWLEQGGKRFVIAYRPREYWKPFENHEVIVTGECYQPYGQAIGATHFRVDTMRFFDPKRGRGPILEVGPEISMQGKLEAFAAPAGSKREGSSETKFVDDTGTAHGIFGSTPKLDGVRPGAPIRITARAIVPDMSWVAQTGGPKIWIVALLDNTADNERLDEPMPCP